MPYNPPAHYFHGGYTQVVIGGAPGAPELSPALVAPEPLGPAGLPYDHMRYGVNWPLVTMPNNEAYAGRSDSQATNVHHWAGPPAGLPRQWWRGMGALAGARQRGWRQQGDNLRLSPAWVYAELRQYRSLRATAQKVNRGAAAQAVPSVFVPVSPTNFYGQLGSY